MDWNNTEAIARSTHCPERNVAEHWPNIKTMLDSMGFFSDNCRFAAIATIAVETGIFKPIHERGGDEYFTRLYQGRMGNIRPGDGARFHGRGFVQLTGRENYAKYGQQLGIDLVSDPDKALEPVTAASLFCLYFRDHHINVAADAGDWERVRRLVNGGLNGYSEFMGHIARLTIPGA
jgi:hypothetical protein